MRRMLGYQWLLITVAGMQMAGCSAESSSDFADSVDAIDEPIALKLPAEAKATPELDVVPEQSKATPLIEPVADEEVRIADSDTPAVRDPSPAEKSTDETVSASQPPQPKERTDRDDPKARTIISVEEKQDDATLNNGRAPAARPLPEGKRVATKDVASAPLSDGRAEGAQRGDEVSIPTKSNPTTKPAPPAPATLADVSDSLRALDKDGDGQVGLYEWPRDQLARFKTLDTNEDGFLTPAELVTDERNGATPSKAAPSKAAPKATAPKTAPKETGKKAKQDDPKKDPIEAEVTSSAKDDGPESATKKDGETTSPAKAATKIDDAEQAPESETADQADAPDDKTTEEDGASAEDKPTQGS